LPRSSSAGTSGGADTVASLFCSAPVPDLIESAFPLQWKEARLEKRATAIEGKMKEFLTSIDK
jgi:hypothetical protein